jgi:hypothetical protein
MFQNKRKWDYSVSWLFSTVSSRLYIAQPYLINTVFRVVEYVKLQPICKFQIESLNVYSIINKSGFDPKVIIKVLLYYFLSLPIPVAARCKA